MPLGILQNKSDKKIRKFLLSYFKIIAIFQFPSNLFHNAKTGISTCLLILEKKLKSKNNNFKIKLFLYDDYKINGYNEVLEFVEKYTKKIIKNKFINYILLNIDKNFINNGYRLDPGFWNYKKYYSNNNMTKILKETIILLKNNTKYKNLKTLDYIDKKNNIFLTEKKNKKSIDKIIKKGDFFYSRMSNVFKFNYLENIIATNEYITFKLLNNTKPYELELILNSNLIQKSLYYWRTGQGRKRLQVEDFLNLNIEKFLKLDFLNFNKEITKYKEKIIKINKIKNEILKKINK